MWTHDITVFEITKASPYCVFQNYALMCVQNEVNFVFFNIVIGSTFVDINKKINLCKNKHFLILESEGNKWNSNDQSLKCWNMMISCSLNFFKWISETILWKCFVLMLKLLRKLLTEFSGKQSHSGKRKGSSFLQIQFFFWVRMNEEILKNN